jgi:hypothetical protein
MSDVYDTGDNLGDSSFLDSSAANSNVADTGAPPAGYSTTSAIPGFTLTGSGDPSGVTVPLVPPVLNLAQPAVTGVTGILGDLTKLVTGVYQGEAQITQAQSQAAIAKANAAKALQTAQTAPNLWLVLGIAAAGIFVLEAMDRK